MGKLQNQRRLKQFFFNTYQQKLDHKILKPLQFTLDLYLVKNTIQKITGINTTDVVMISYSLKKALLERKSKIVASPVCRVPAATYKRKAGSMP